jgi:Na+/melibiose symporter-like transporter
MIATGVPRSMGLLWVSTIFTAMGVFGTRSNSVWLVSVVVVLGGLGMGAINGLEPAIVSEMVRILNEPTNQVVA